MSLELANISFTHPGTPRDSHQLLERINLRVGAGELVGLTAPSGAGKSTLIRIAALMLGADSGTVSINNRLVMPNHEVPSEMRRNLGVVLQSSRAASDPRLRLESLICAPLDFRSGALRPRPTQHAERLGQLADLVQLSPKLLRSYPHQVSDGQLQRAMIARSLVLEPSVLICDEPTSALDAQTTRTILQLLARQATSGTAVLVASHDAEALGQVAHRMQNLAELGAPQTNAVERTS
ncbi:ABC transporter ATP-binding protein [Arthrobacter sp. MYb227]|uniref:ABC transporter ATP-binding protein n=1 Tax=Arthrobacter sp. MYb227 TaxID=1848601 RepID=UPI000CFADF28|nr:ATP-binding cassette domain-containing protein [Arthrobacter sp. MYb227]PQZ89079.1 ABC transporter ATP-binding protein [Arthrobacter sp. MYb227]